MNNRKHLQIYCSSMAAFRNIKLVEDPGKCFLVIMNDGTIYKNALSR